MLNNNYRRRQRHVSVVPRKITYCLEFYKTRDVLRFSFLNEPRFEAVYQKKICYGCKMSNSLQHDVISPLAALRQKAE